MPIVSRINNRPRPRNDGSTNIARSSIDQITPVAMQQQMNALAVDGIPCLYFVKKFSGQPCTCSGLVQTPNPDGTVGMPTTPGSHTVNPPGFGSDEFIASMTEGTQYRIERYGARSRMLDANNINNRNRAWPYAPSAEGVMRAPDLNDPFARQVDTLDDVTGDTVDASDLGFTDAASQNVDAAAVTTSCGVCLGTNYVGGYDLMNGLRVVYDTQAEWRGAVLDATAKPNAFTATGFAELRMTIPRGARALQLTRVWNNKDVVVGAAPMLYVNGVWAPFAVGMRSITKGVPTTVRVQFPDQGATTFTHVEFMFDLGMEPVLLGWNRMNYNEDLSRIDMLDDVSVVIPPNVPITSLYDIITEPVYRRAWKVTTTANSMDRYKKVNGSEATLRVLQTYEIQNLLPNLYVSLYYRGEQMVNRRRYNQGEQSAEPYRVEQTSPKR